MQSHAGCRSLPLDGIFLMTTIHPDQYPHCQMTKRWLTQRGNDILQHLPHSWRGRQERGPRSVCNVNLLHTIQSFSLDMFANKISNKVDHDVLPCPSIQPTSGILQIFTQAHKLSCDTNFAYRRRIFFKTVANRYGDVSPAVPCCRMLQFSSRHRYPDPDCRTQPPWTLLNCIFMLFLFRLMYV